MNVSTPVQTEQLQPKTEIFGLVKVVTQLVKLALVLQLINVTLVVMDTSKQMKILVLLAVHKVIGLM